jgi:hypothetical protein
MKQSSLPTAKSSGLLWWRRRILGTVLAVLSGCLEIPHASAQAFEDISGQVSITKSGLVLNRATKTLNTVVTIANTSSAVINGPLVLNVSAITPSTVTLANMVSQGPSGSPYVTLTVPPNGLSPGGVISNVLLEFNDPSRSAFSFSLSVAAIEGPLPAAVLSSNHLREPRFSPFPL